MMQEFNALQEFIEHEIGDYSYYHLKYIILSEDCWEKIDYFTPTVKYFWLALLTD